LTQAVTLGPYVQEPTPNVAVTCAPINRAAQVQPLAVADLPNPLVGWVDQFVVPPSSSHAFPTSVPATVSGTGIDGAIKSVYNAIEP
jgi:hypothetical protein